jgi:hypothetical protein
MTKSLTVFALALLVGRASGQYVLDSINAGGMGSMVYNEAARVIYGTEPSYGFVAISTDSNNVISRIPAEGTFLVAYSATSAKAYCSFGHSYSESLLVVDGRTHQRLRALYLYDAKQPLWDPDSDRLYVACGDDNEVAVFSCRNDSLLARIRVGQYPLRLVLNRRHRRVYSLNDDGVSVSIIDMDRLSLVRTIGLGTAPQAGWYSTVSDRCYIGVARPEVVVIDGARDSLRGRISIPGGATTLSMVGCCGDSVLAVGGELLNRGDIYTLDVIGESFLQTLPAGREPRGGAWSEGTGLLYYPCTISDNLIVVGDRLTRVTAVLPVSDGPNVALAVSGRVYLGHINSPWVYVIRDTCAGIAEVDPSVAVRAPTLAARPNPFRGSPLVRCLQEASHEASLRVYAQTGALVRTLAGGGSWYWDGRDDHGRPVPAGVYALRSIAEAGATLVVKTE